MTNMDSCGNFATAISAALTKFQIEQSQLGITSAGHHFVGQNLAVIVAWARARECAASVEAVSIPPARRSVALRLV